MRTGLVLIGVVILLVGGAVFLFVLFPPTHGVPFIQTTPFLASAGPHGSGVTHPWEVTSEPPGSVALFWVANASIGLNFYDAAGCPLFVQDSCSGHPLVSWPQNASGLYTNASGVICPCFVIPVNGHNFPVGVNGYLVVTYQNSVPSLSPWAYGAIFFGSVILLVIGGLALFLGVFLRGGVFRRTRPPSGSALEFLEGDRDVEGPPEDGSYGPTDPRTDSKKRGAG